MPQERFSNWLLPSMGLTNFFNQRLYWATFNYCQKSLQAGVLILLLNQKVAVPDHLSLSELIENYSRYLPNGLVNRIKQSDFVKTTPLTFSSRSVLEAYVLSEKCHLNCYKGTATLARARSYGEL
ncbi:MAG: hypothetical protein HC820_07035 [Hydrococcus sp. RM1_1_31]|nr:hypothetical protein [Hydrococcus sp. RM1_1_31]